MVEPFCRCGFTNFNLPAPSALAWGIGSKRKAGPDPCLILWTWGGAFEKTGRGPSGGELRRVLLAHALGKEPDLLVLDEAEAGVDWKGERMFWQLLTKARENMGFTLIVVSHNLPLCAHYATNVISHQAKRTCPGAPAKTLSARTAGALARPSIFIRPSAMRPGPLAGLRRLSGAGQHQGAGKGACLRRLWGLCWPGKPIRKGRRKMPDLSFLPDLLAWLPFETCSRALCARLCWGFCCFARWQPCWECRC